MSMSPRRHAHFCTSLLLGLICFCTSLTGQGHCIHLLYLLQMTISSRRNDHFLKNHASPKCFGMFCLLYRDNTLANFRCSHFCDILRMSMSSRRNAHSEKKCSFCKHIMLMFVSQAIMTSPSSHYKSKLPLQVQTTTTSSSYHPF